MPRSNASGGTDAIAPRTKRSTSYPQLRLAIVHHWTHASAPKRSATSPTRSRQSLRDGRRDPGRDRIGGMTKLLACADRAIRLRPTERVKLNVNHDNEIKACHDVTRRWAELKFALLSKGERITAASVGGYLC